MRVALLTREYPPDVYGGAGVHVQNLARALAPLVELEVHAFGEPRDDPLVAGSYRHREALDGDRPELAALRALSTDLVMTAGVAGTDLVHSHTWYTNFAGHLAKLVYDVPHVVTTHSLEPLRPWKREQLRGGYTLSTFVERTALTHADAVVAVSASMRDDVLAAYRAVDPDRVVVIPNGVDTELYRPVDETDALERHGVDTGRPYVIFVGRVTRQKGVLHLLDAVHRLPADAQVVVCAGAPDTPEVDAEFRRRVQRLADAPADVVLIEGTLPHRDLVQLLSHARVLLCPSVYEPFGIVNLEAMACGLPVVASEVGGIPEVVVHDETGHLVPFEAAGDDAYGAPSDPAAFAQDLADAVANLLYDGEAARAMGVAGRRRVQEHFSWTTVAERTAALYQRLR